MSRYCILLVCVLLLLPGAAVGAETPERFATSLQDGDIIFHPSQSFQSKVIEQATRSPYTHCGVIFFNNGRPEVLEATSTVRFTPLQEWINRGVDRTYLVLRLRDPLTPEQARLLREAGKPFEGKQYDLLFQWTDDQIYCSELVWKMYDRALGIELCPLKPFKSYDLNHPAVQAEIEKRFKGSFPWDEPAVAPSDLLESPLLEVVARD